MVMPMASFDIGRGACLAARRALVVLAAALAVSACQADRPFAGSAAHVSAYAAPEQVVLDLPVRQGGLTAAEHGATANFMQAYQAEGQGALEVMSPVGGNASLTVGQVRHVARQNGVPEAAMVFSTYQSKTPNPAIALRYQRRLHAQDMAGCGRWPSNLAVDWENMNYENFGCATANNLSVMVEDPNDLYGPRAMTPRDAERRDTIFENYRTGEATAAESETDSATTASDVGE